MDNFAKQLKKKNLLGLAATLLLAFSNLLNAEVNFEKEIWPILDRSCVNCHKAPYKKNGKLKKPKGGYRLDTAEMIMKSGDNAPSVVPGKPKESSFYHLTTLPEDDDDIMPAKGDPLTKAEQELIRKWIAEGANFGSWKQGKVSTNQKNKTHKKAETLIEKIAKTVKAPNAAAVKAIESDGALILPLAQKHPLLQVNYRYIGKKLTPAILNKLNGVKDQVTWLNVAGSDISDNDLKIIAGLKNLTNLHLEKTNISDAGLKHIAGLKNLEYLNLYGTKVSDQGLKSLHGMKNLKKLYLWQSKVSKSSAQGLSKIIPGILVDTGYEAPVKTVAKKTPAKKKEDCCGKCEKSKKASAAKDKKCCGKCKKDKQATGAKAKDKKCCGKCKKDKHTHKHTHEHEHEHAHDHKHKHDHKKGDCCGKCKKKPAAKAAALKFKAGSCCDKASKAGKQCGHGCCVKAVKANSVCKKCNG